MVVGCQRDAAQLKIGIVGHFGRHLVDGDSLEDGLHGLLRIHRNSCSGIGSHDNTCSILPLLELIPEVLGGFQRHHGTFLILFHVWIARDRASLSRRQHLRVQRVLGSLRSSTHECSCNDEVGKTHLLVITQSQEREVQFQGVISRSCDAIYFLRECGNSQALATTIDSSILY